MKIRSAVIGYAALTVILTAGAAQGLAGTNTVTSDDVVNETLTSADVKNESLTSSDIKNESLRGSDILNGSLSGSDIAGYRRAQFALIDADGNRERGTATDANQESGLGHYTVEFPSGIDVRKCAWSGSEADFPNGDSLTTKRVVSIKSDYDDRWLSVYITDSTSPTGDRADAGFALVGVC